MSAEDTISFEVDINPKIMRNIVNFTRFFTSIYSLIDKSYFTLSSKSLNTFRDLYA